MARKTKPKTAARAEKQPVKRAGSAGKSAKRAGRKARPLAAARSRLAIRPGRQLLYLGRKDVSHLPFEPGEMINHALIALREIGRGKVEAPAHVSLFPQREALFSASPAHVPNVLGCGLKWFSNFPGNLRRELPQVSAIVVLSDPHSGFPIAVMDGTWLTAQRGPAVSAVACRLLARPESLTAAVIGAGVQGRGHLKMLPAVLGHLNRIKLYDVAPAAASAAAASAAGQIRVDVVKSAAMAVRGADVVVSATAVTSKPAPSISPDQIKQGALVLPLDLDAIFEPAVFERADRVYVDSMADLESLRDLGLFKRGLPGNVSGQLGDLVAGRIGGRGADAERIVCLNVGTAAVDMVLARAVFEKACRLGVGTILDI